MTPLRDLRFAGKGNNAALDYKSWKRWMTAKVSVEVSGTGVTWKTVVSKVALPQDGFIPVVPVQEAHREHDHSARTRDTE